MATVIQVNVRCVAQFYKRGADITVDASTARGARTRLTLLNWGAVARRQGGPEPQGCIFPCRLIAFDQITVFLSAFFVACAGLGLLPITARIQLRTDFQELIHESG
jgi:hypothetical protein